MSNIEINQRPEPSYKHGLKIRIIPTINYKDISTTTPATIDSTANLITEGDITPFLLDGKDKQYYTDAEEAEKYFLEIPEDSKQKIQITTNAQSPARTGLFITAKKNSHTELILTHNGNATYDAETIGVITEEGASLKIILVQTYANETHSFKHCTARIGKDSNVEWISALLGGSYTHASFVNLLEHQGGKGTSTVLYLASNKQQFDIDTQSIHKNKETYSNILTRGAVNEQAKALSRGLVRIEENAFGSNGYEKQDALILSKTAEADAIPNLEIHNHDVKCSHGSTIGQVDENLLFYLMSRGISKESAINTIIAGFFNPVLAELDSETKAYLEEKISEAL